MRHNRIPFAPLAFSLLCLSRAFASDLAAGQPVGFQGANTQPPVLFRDVRVFDGKGPCS